MKRILISLLTAILILSPNAVFAQSPSPETQSTPIAEVNSFDLFWPISAGKVEGESFYFLKSLKENLRGLLIFSPFKKIEYNIVLSEKRAVESEKLLLDKKDYANAGNTLNNLVNKWQTITDGLKTLENESKKDLINRYKSSLEKQRALLQYLEAQVSSDNKQILNETLQRLNENLANI